MVNKQQTSKKWRICHQERFFNMKGMHGHMPVWQQNIVMFFVSPRLAHMDSHAARSCSDI